LPAHFFCFVVTIQIYLHKWELLGSEALRNKVLKKVQDLLNVPARSCLALFAAQKGVVYGDLTITGHDDVMNCMKLGLHAQGYPINGNVDWSKVEFDSEAKCILVVEAKTMMFCLMQHGFHERRRCILISGSGNPDIATREFLKKLHEHFPEMGIFALGGFKMLKAYGDVPVKWLGVRPSQVDELEARGYRVRSFSSDEEGALTPSERRQIEELLEQKTQSPDRQKELEAMLGRDFRNLAIEKIFEMMDDGHEFCNVLHEMLDREEAKKSERGAVTSCCWMDAI
jgi:hypothetical protein